MWVAGTAVGLLAVMSKSEEIKHTVAARKLEGQLLRVDLFTCLQSDFDHNAS